MRFVTNLFLVMGVPSSFHAGQAAQAAQCWGLQTGPMHVSRTIYTLHKGNSENSLELNAK